MRSDKANLYLKLRVVFTVLAAICVAAVIPVGVFLGLTGALICAGLAFLLYLVMLTFKLKHESITPQTEEQHSSNVGNGENSVGEEEKTDEN